jgi:hypothetical protein
VQRVSVPMREYKSLYLRAIIRRGENPYLDHDRHFSSFGTRIVAEHFVALTQHALPRGER